MSSHNIKICTRCKESKPNNKTAFYLDSRSGKPHNPCKKCRAEMVREKMKSPLNRAAHNESCRIRCRGAEISESGVSEDLDSLNDIFGV